MRKTILFLMLSATFLFSACASEEASETAPIVQEPQQSDQSGFMWQIEALSHETTVYMESTGAMMMYDGSVEQTDYSDGADEGKIYLLLELNLAKAEVGNMPFSWADTYIEDAEGNKYTRLEDDLFLENHDYARLPSTDLKLGESSGFIAFEIDETAAENELFFVHTASEGENRIQIQ